MAESSPTRKAVYPIVALIAFQILWSIFKRILVALQPDLRKVPGPLLSRFTALPLRFAVISGRRSLYIHNLHERYGPYVRIAPEEVHTADFEAFRTIHRVGSDWDKGKFYKGQVPSQTTDENSGVFGTRSNQKASHRRRLFQAAGTKKVAIEWEPEIKALATLMVQKIKNELKEHGSSDVMKWLTFYTSDVVGSLAFGHSFHHIENGTKGRLLRDVETMMPIIGIRMEMPWTKPIMDNLPTWCPGSASELWRRTEGYGKDGVRATRRAQTDFNTKTIFSKMVLEDAKDQSVPDSVIEQEASNIIIAGTDSTSMTLTYLIYTVLRHPHVKQELVAELNTCTADPNLQELETKIYLNNVITESMRLHPGVPGSLTRVVPKGGETALKYKLPAGTEIGTQAYTFQRDPSVFDDPLTFNPDRWLTATPAMREHLMYFGGSARMCVGQNVARIEILHAVSRFFRECEGVRLADSTTEESMAMVDYFAITPRGGKCVVVPG